MLMLRARGLVIGAISAIAVAVVTAMVGLRTYPRQKAVDREEELRKARSKAYEAYLSTYAETERWRGVTGKEKEFGEALLSYSKNYSALFNVAEDSVIRPTSSFHEFVFVENNSDWDYYRWVTEWKRRHAAMLVAMRRDAFVQTTAISEEELAERLPWVFDWDIGAKSHEEIPTEPPLKKSP
jgi:hypothetical protein